MKDGFTSRCTVKEMNPGACKEQWNKYNVYSNIVFKMKQVSNCPTGQRKPGYRHIPGFVLCSIHATMKGLENIILRGEKRSERVYSTFYLYVMSRLGKSQRIKSVIEK